MMRPLLTALLLALPAAAHAATLTIAVSANVNTLDPDQSASVQTDLSVISHLYTPLVIRSPDLKLQPALAESWRAVDDRTWEFRLRPGVAFPDGEPLDAEAVKWNVARILAPETKSRIRAWLDPIAEVQAPDPTTVRIVTKEPYPALAGQLSMVFLLPPRWTAGHDPAREALGTGPYDLVRFAPGDRIELAAKAAPLGSKPAFDQVVVRMIPDAAARVSAVLAGEVDLAADVPPADIARINASGRAEAGGTDSTRGMFIKINTLKPPFRDHPELRRALNYAIDKKTLIEQLLGGLAHESACQVLSPAYFGYNPDLRPYPFDPDKARTLVKQSGLPTPIEVELENPVGAYLLGQDIVQAVAAELEDVGFKVAIREMEFGAYLNKYIKGGDLGQLSYLGQAWPSLDADGLLTLFDAGNAYAYWNDAEFSRLLDTARATTDQARRTQLYADATRRMCDEAPVAFLFNQPQTYALSKRVRWQVRGDSWMRAADVSLR